MHRKYDVFWEQRSLRYNNLQWVQKRDYIDRIIERCELHITDSVLCLGTGTGIPANYLSHKVKSVIGVDTSESMLEIARKNKRSDNTTFVYGDIRKLHYPDESFSRIVARMSFHHLIWGLNRAMDEAYRLLMPGGLFCISEGVPPDRCVETFYKDIFRIKEQRRTFFPEDLKMLLKNRGFRNIKETAHIIKCCSIRNWLENAGNLTVDERSRIYSMHIQLHDIGKSVYNMEVTDEDCFIDMRFIITTGRK